MIKSRLLLFPLIAVLTGCNLFSTMDKPKGDPQLMEAARACLDKADYVCARELYQQLSDDAKDVRISELSFTTMAENRVFSIQDLISNLGSNRGGATTYTLLAETMASRGKTDGVTRGLLQTSYATNSSISNSNLKAFMQFLTAFATFNQIMSAAVGADGKLTAADLVLSPASCRASNCLSDPDCGAPVGSGISDVTGDVTSMATSTGWSGGASFGKLQVAAAAAGDALTALGGSSNMQGILDLMKQIDTQLGAAGAACKRQGVLTVLFP